MLIHQTVNAMMFCRFTGASLFIGVLLFAGCTKKTDAVDVWGSVKWKGASVPKGIVTFTPDANKGGRGHQGYALIRDGKYDTRAPDSKNIKAGPYIVTVSSKQLSTDKSHPRGTSLILKHDQPIVIPSTSGELEIVVPDTVNQVMVTPD